MTRLLDVLEEYLEWRGMNYLRLDGDTSTAERGPLVDTFNDPEEQVRRGVGILLLEAGRY